MKETLSVLTQWGYGEVASRDGRLIYGQTDTDYHVDSQFSFIEHPENPEAARLFDDPKYLSSVFTKGGFSPAEPKNIVNTGGTTMFTSAGIQVLEDVFHHSQPLPKNSLYVAQPVFRTQYMSTPGEGYCSSFINIATLSAGQTAEQHISHIEFWFNFLLTNGFKENGFQFISEQSAEKWGDKKIIIDILRINYKGLPIGDANFIASFPQLDRDPFTVSDIGFGLERIRWIMAGGSFWKGIYSSDTADVDIPTLDAYNTIALLTGCGVTPSHNEAGYRLRKLSKQVVAAQGGNYSNLERLAEGQHERWSKWTALSHGKEEVWSVMEEEHRRNLHSLLIQNLRNMGYRDVGIELSLPTRKFVSLLHGTSVKDDDLSKALTKLNISIT